jgi:hypothetical protein
LTFKEQNMARDKHSPTGQISFRLSLELQTKLYAIAQELNLDVSGLVKAMIAEQLPAWEKRAAGMKRRRLAARYKVEEADVPLVHVAMLAGLKVGLKEAPKKRVWDVMRAAVEDVRRLDALSMQAVLLAAGHELAHIEIEVDRQGAGPEFIAQVVEPEIRGRD